MGHVGPCGLVDDGSTHLQLPKLFEFGQGNAILRNNALAVYVARGIDFKRGKCSTQRRKEQKSKVAKQNRN
jgi:hypothetical protein